MKATEVLAELGYVLGKSAGLTGDARERRIVELAQSGNVPAFLNKTIPIALIEWSGESIAHELVIHAMPEPFGLGENASWVRMPTLMPTCEALAGDEWTLPTPQIVLAIHDRAAVQLVPIPHSEPRNSLETYAKHNAAIEAALATTFYTVGDLVSGEAKDYVVARKGLAKNGKPAIAIFGWFDPSGTYTDGRKNAPIQSLNTTDHDASYGDYSQIPRFVRKKCQLDGRDDDLERVYRDPRWAKLSGSDLGMSAGIYPTIDRPIGSRLARAGAGFLLGLGVSIGLPLLLRTLRGGT